MKFLERIKDAFCPSCKRYKLDSKKAIDLERELILLLEKEPLKKSEIINHLQRKGYSSNQIYWCIRKMTKKGIIKFITRTKGHRVYFLQESVL